MGNNHYLVCCNSVDGFMPMSIYLYDESCRKKFIFQPVSKRKTLDIKGFQNQNVA